MMIRFSVLWLRDSVVYLFIFLLIPNSSAIIIRHDAAPSAYEISASSFPAVFFLEQQGSRKVCAATIIHPQWALTAAHCLEETLLNNTLANDRDFAVIVAGQDREIDTAIVHPDFDRDSASDVDLALLRFKSAATSPRPMPIQLESVELGSIVSLLGWGYFGVGTRGRQYSDGELRLAKNRITAIEPRVRISFDDPRESDGAALALEGMPSLGDSGGPALLENGGGRLLLGITVGEVEGVDFSEETQGKYGSIAVYETVYLHIDWIETVIGASAPFDS